MLNLGFIKFVVPNYTVPKYTLPQNSSNDFKVVTFINSTVNGFLIMSYTTTNGKKKRKYGLLTAGFLSASLVCGGYSAVNAWSLHTFDKYVIKQIEIAANVPTVSRSSKSPSGLSMESSLEEARRKLDVSRLENPAIIWETPLTEISTLDDLLGQAIERARQIGQFQESFSEGKVPKTAPQWVKDAHHELNMSYILSTLHEYKLDKMSGIIPSLAALTQSEYGQRIGSEYEALNTVVAGGTRTQGKSLTESQHSGYGGRNRRKIL